MCRKCQGIFNFFNPWSDKKLKCDKEMETLKW